MSTDNLPDNPGYDCEGFSAGVTAERARASTSLYESAEDWIRSNFPAPQPPPPPTAPAPPNPDYLGCGELPSAACVFPLYVWLVDNPSGSWDEIREVVVVAAEEESAIEAAKLGTMSTRDRKRVSALRIGIALPGARPGAVLCTDVLEA